jgi:hypothetical protein
MRPIEISGWATFIGFAFLPFGATAHHSFAATFDVAVVEELEGEIMSVQWQNPHVLFTLRGMDGQGQETIFEIESHSLSIMRRMDIPPEVLRVGDTVRVAGHPARRSNDAMFVLNALLPGGQEVVFDPFGQERWAENIGTTEVWQATEDDAVAQQSGIFRVWSTTLSDPAAFPFPEAFDLSLIDRYPLTESARASIVAFDPVTDIPTLNCAPKGMPAIMEQPYPMEIVDQGGEILLRLEEYDTTRTIHMDQSADSDGPSSRLGYSIGRWEGNTLVVETTRLNWPHFNTVGVPLSSNAEIIERFIPINDGTRLNYELIVTDPATFTEPVELGKYWLALPGIEVQPYECIN